MGFRETFGALGGGIQPPAPQSPLRKLLSFQHFVLQNCWCEVRVGVLGAKETLSSHYHVEKIQNFTAKSRDQGFVKNVGNLGVFRGVFGAINILSFLKILKLACFQDFSYSTKLVDYFFLHIGPIGIITCMPLFS